MILSIYKRVLAALWEKPWKLWGISWLCMLMIYLSASLFLIPLLALAVSVLFEVAFSVICLTGYRRQNISSLMIFENFKSWPRVKRMLCGMGWMYLWIFVWGLIPGAGIVFAIMRAYEYRFVPYILAFEPEIAPKDALEESKKRTEGLRGQMFWADVLPVVAFSLAYEILYIVADLTMKWYVGYLLLIAAILLLAVFCLVYPLFLGLVKAAWYDEVMNGPAKPITKVCPVCGKLFPAKITYCDNCGVALVENKEE